MVRPADRARAWRPPGDGGGTELKRSKPAKVATGSRSLCETYRGVIEVAVVQGLSAQRIHQDLVADHAFTGRYNTVKSFVRALAAVTPLPFRRMESAPGEQMQVDFGQGAPVVESGKKRRPHLFRATLSFPRKKLQRGGLAAGYRELPTGRSPIRISFIRASGRDGWSATLASRREWARMRMAPTDIADLTGAACT